MQKMYNGEKYVLGKYKTRETQRMLISVGLRVMLRLTQVYLNLLNNAVKYTNPGGSIRLEISEELSGTAAVETVQHSFGLLRQVDQVAALHRLHDDDGLMVLHADLIAFTVLHGGVVVVRVVELDLHHLNFRVLRQDLLQHLRPVVEGDAHMAHLTPQPSGQRRSHRPGKS
jgi:hypothetical protein